MIKLFILLGLFVLAMLFIWQIRLYLSRDTKLEELRKTKLEGSMLDIEKEIAEEKTRQKEVSSEIDDINSSMTKDNNDE